MASISIEAPSASAATPNVVRAGKRVSKNSSIDQNLWMTLGGAA